MRALQIVVESRMSMYGRKHALEHPSMENGLLSVNDIRAEVDYPYYM